MNLTAIPPSELPRLGLRVAALDNRKFGADNGIAEPSAELQAAARVQCDEVQRLKEPVLREWIDDTGREEQDWKGQPALHRDNAATNPAQTILPSTEFR